MNNLFFGVAVASVALSVTGQASAADVPVKAARVAAYNPCGVARFTGFYVGGNVGANAYTAHRKDLDGFLDDNSAWTATDIAPTAGVQVGYDWQSCNKVFGVVADWNWTNAKTTTLDEPNDPPTNSIESKMRWFSTLRARAGLAVNDTLFYVTGGVAAARIETTITDPPVTFSDSKTRWGAVGGVGAEFALANNWSLNTEVLYMQFAKQSETFTTPGGTRFAFDLSDSAWVGRLGLNYRWGNPHAAYAAAMPVKGAASLGPCGPSRFNGGYIGGNVGASAYTAHRNDTDGFLFDNSGWTATSISPTAGVQAGYDWQSCNKVFGVVTDWNWTNAKATTTIEPNSPPVSSIESQMNWFGTIRGRAGLAVNDTLVYVTGGVAAAQIKTTIAESPDSFTFDKTRWGVVGGAGAEFALGNNWSVNTEVLYMQFAKQNVTITRGGFQSAFDLNDSAWVGRLGLNYRWGNPQAAYAAARPGPCGPSRFNGGYVGGNIGGNSYTGHHSDLDGLHTDNAGWSEINIAATAGVQAGYDWQSCNKVFGVVADLNWTNAKTDTPDNPNGSLNGDTTRSQMRGFGTIRGRAGLAVNDTLVYVTGGVAAAQIKTAIIEAPDSFSFSKTRWGVVGGAGAEFALGNNWSVNTEVLYMQFAKQSVTFTDSSTNVNTFDFNDSAWIGRVGLNYRWSGGG